MKLAEYQRELLRLSFTEQASVEDFAAFGADRERFFLYRNMIRSRLVGMAKQAFRGTREVLGDAWLEDAFARYLAQSPPRSAFIRDVIADFGPVLAELLASRQLSAQQPAFAVDLARFEESKWRIAYRESPEVQATELSFELSPLFNPALTLLPLEHAVHEREGLDCAQKSLNLLIYRPPAADDIRWYPAHPLFSAIYTDATEDPARPLSELVRQAAEAMGHALDDSLLGTLATEVTLALQRGVLLGSRQP